MLHAPGTAFFALIGAQLLALVVGYMPRHGGAPHCAADDYPRTLPNVLTRAQRKHLSNVYFRHVHGRSRPGATYYQLLRSMVKADEQEYEQTRAALAAVRAAVEKAFGDRFVVANDFFSFRGQKTRLFPAWHQDYEFWLTDSSRCANFNLWILLDHERMNHSFDLYEVRRNPWLYDALYSRVAKAGWTNASGAVPMLPVRYFQAHGHRERLPVGGSPPEGVAEPTVSRLPLRRGEALVLRQMEVHRTDKTKLHSGQWRLAIGFKLLERLPLARLPLLESPFAREYMTCRLLYPGMLPALRMGTPFPDVYTDERVRSYKATPESLTTFVQRSVQVKLQERPELLLAFAVPTTLVAALLFAARASARTS